MADLNIDLELRVTPRAFKGLLALALLSVLAQELSSETVTLTTYYPAPSGVYTQMITTGNTFLARDGAAKVGIGTTGLTANRLTVVSPDNSTNDIVEVLPANLTQGVAITYNSVKEIGSNGNNSIYFDAQQNGNIVLGSANASENIGFGTASPPAGPTRWFSFPPLNDGRNYSDGITWYAPSPNTYGIYRTAGAWAAGNYQQLEAKWDTGIVLDGGTAYGLSGTLLQPNGGNVGIGTGLTKAGGLLQVGSPTGQTGVMGAYHPCNAAGAVNASCGAGTYATTMSGVIAKYIALESPIQQPSGSATLLVQPSFFCCPCPASGCPSF
jgi:hypothetical protein